MSYKSAPNKTKQSRRTVARKAAQQARGYQPRRAFGTLMVRQVWDRIFSGRMAR